MIEAAEPGETSPPPPSSSSVTSQMGHTIDNYGHTYQAFVVSAAGYDPHTVGLL